MQGLLPDSADVEIKMTMQERSKESVPDAVIMQDSFKIIIETKPNAENLYFDQLKRHLNAFNNEVYKVMLTLSRNSINGKLEKEVNQYITDNRQQVFFKHITFEWLLSAVREVLDDRDYEMLEVLDDYSKFCYESGLIPNQWKWMVIRNAGMTKDANMRLNLYYHKSSAGKIKGYEYLGLCADKSVFAIGKITMRVDAVKENGKLKLTIDPKEQQLLTDDVKNRIEEAITDGEKYGYSLDSVPHTYYILDKFIETDFKKTSSGGLFGSKAFDLTKYVNGMTKATKINEIAETLKKVTWT